MDALLQSANVKYQTGLYSEALADLNTFLNSNPSREKRASALISRAAVYKCLGKVNLAILDFNEVIEESDSPNVSILINRGIALAEIGRYNESLFDMNLAVQADIDGVSGLIGRSFTYYQFGDYSSSANDLLQAIRKSPNDARLRLKCAQVLNKAKRFEEAMAIFEASKVINSADAKIFAGMAVVRESQKQFSEAIKQATIAINMDNQLTSAMIVRAIASLNLGNLSDAVKDSERVLELASIESPDSATAVTIRALISCLVGDYEAAIVNCSKAIDIWQDIGHLWFLRGAARCRQPSVLKQGLKDLQIAARLDPKLTRVCELLQSIAMKIPLQMRQTNPPDSSKLPLAIENQPAVFSRKSSLSDIFESNFQLNDGTKQGLTSAANSASSTQDNNDDLNQIRKDTQSEDRTTRKASMNVDEVCEMVMGMNWPDRLKEDFLRSVREQKIDGKLLMSLEDPDLEELGITSAFQRRRILLEIKEMRESQS